MTKKKKAVEPQGMDCLSLRVEPSRGAMLNEMAKVTCRSKASIIKELLYAGLDKWSQTRGAK